jgi:hypothetical protein
MSLPGQLARVQKSYWTAPPDFSRLFTTILSFTTNLPIPPGWLPLALLASLLTLFMAIYQTIEALKSGGEHLQAGLWLAYMSITPVLLLFIVSQVYPVYIERALLPSGAVYLGWVAWSLTNTRLLIPIRYLTLFLLVVGMGIGFPAHHLPGISVWAYSGLVQ